MKVYEYPQIDSASDAISQLSQIKSYLFKLTDTLNYNLEKQSATCIFENAAKALSSTDVVELEQQRNKDYKALRRAVLTLAARVITCDGTYYNEEPCGEVRASNIVSIGGGNYTVAGLIIMLFEKIVTLENELKEMKGE